MQSKKMWQTLFVLTLFLIAAAVFTYIVTCFRNVKWKVFFGVGTALLLIALSPLLLRRKRPKIALLSLCIDAVACGLLVGSYFIGSNTSLSLKTVILSAIVSAGTYLAIMLLLSLPVLRKNRVYIVCIYILWCVALFAAGGFLWNRYGGEKYASFTLFSVSTAFFAFGSLSPSAELDELLLSLALPASLAVGVIALIVLTVLVCGDGGDCDCGDCGDCCDCTPDYGGKKTKRTTMSRMSDPRHMD